MIPFFDMHAAHAALQDDLQTTFSRVSQSGHLIMGSELEAFEQEFAAYCGARFCVGVGNGLDALALALRAKGVGPGDEVIVPSQTFIATWLAVSMVGATPVPVEIDELHYVLDPARIVEKITPRTVAIIPVHLFGQPAKMDEICAIAEAAGLFVLEDAAQAHGARLSHRRCGALGHAAAFSFYPTKNLGAFGDGGAIVTDDSVLADDLMALRNYGSRVKYVHEVQGVNSRLDELQAAILRVKLPLLDEWNGRRCAIAARYEAGLRGIESITTPSVIPGTDHVFHLYVIATAQRDQLSAFLKERGIMTAVHYPTAPHMQEAFLGLGIGANDLPKARRAASETLSLPMWPQMSEGQVDTVIAGIREFSGA